VVKTVKNLIINVVKVKWDPSDQLDPEEAEEVVPGLDQRAIQGQPV
jgi:hypothetical protein